MSGPLPFTFDGGIDLVTPQQHLRPGVLRDALNFEVGRERGYVSCSGFVGFDGSDSATQTVVLRLANDAGLALSNLPSVGQQVYIGTDQINGYVIGTQSGPEIDGSAFNVREIFAIFPPHVLDVAQSSSIYNVTAGDYIRYTSGNAIAGFTYAQASTIYGTQGDYRTYHNDVVTAGRNRICNVPGQRDVLGVHVYRDQVYAVREFEAVRIRLDAYRWPGHEPLEGSVIVHVGTQGHSYHEVIRVTPQNSGDWEIAGSEFVYILRHIHSASTTDTFSTDATPASNVYQASDFSDGLMCGGALGMALGDIHDFTVYATSVRPALGTPLTFVRDHPINTTAYKGEDSVSGLWRAMPTGGWEEVYMGREIRFMDGTDPLHDIVGYQRTIDPATAAAHILSTASGAGTAVNLRYDRAGTIGTINNLLDTDSDNATLTATAGSKQAEQMVITGFESVTGNIPPNAIVLGVQVTIGSSTNAAAGAEPQQYFVMLHGVGSTTGTDNISFTGKRFSGHNVVLGAKKRDTFPYSATNVSVLKTFGAKDDLWTVGKISGSDVRSPDFGVQIFWDANATGLGVSCVSAISTVQMTIHYRVGDSTFYARGPSDAMPPVTTDVKLTLIKQHRISGTYSAATGVPAAGGVLTIVGQKHFHQERRIKAGDAFYSASGGGGSLLGTAVGSDYPVTLPGMHEIDAEESMYLWHNGNFYGSERYNQMMGVNGAGPGFTYDGTYFIRLFLAVQDDLNKPRHIEKHGDFLALGLKGGAIFFSAGNEPEELDPNEGATEVDIGDRVTGLISLNGDAMAVFGQVRNHILKGITPQSFAKSTLSGNSGCIEYTAVDMGPPIYCDAFGIMALESTTTSSSTFIGNELSYRISPWINPRLQYDEIFPERRPAFAIPVRNKRQYRLYFKDGYWMSMTLEGADRTPVFMPGRFDNPLRGGQATSVYFNNRACALRCATSQILSDGRERIFGAFSPRGTYTYNFNNAHEKVVELDVGNTFNGSYVRSFVTFFLNHSSDQPNKSPIEVKKLSEFLLFAQGMQYGTLQMTLEQNWKTPIDPEGYQTLTKASEITYGLSTEQVLTKPQVFMTSKQRAVEGYGISIRLQHNRADASNGTQPTIPEPPITLQSAVATFVPRGTSRGHAPKP